MALFRRMAIHQLAHKFIATEARLVGDPVRKMIPLGCFSTNTGLPFMHRPALTRPLLLKTPLNAGMAPRRHLWGMLNVIFNRPDMNRIKEVGPHRACAEWLLRCGAHVRWKDIDRFQTDYNSLPSGPFDKFKIEEVNADNAAVMAIGFSHFDGVDTIKKIRFHHCGYLYDDAIFELAKLKGSLEDLEISSCGDVSDKGLQSLAELTWHQLSSILIVPTVQTRESYLVGTWIILQLYRGNLKRLVLYDLPEVRHKEEALKKLQTALPNCKIDFKDIQDKPA